MKLPRDVSGRQLAQALARKGYILVRQRGSHLQLVRSTDGGEHRITIPDHPALRVGTLAAILNDVADHLVISREDLVEQLFG